MAKNKRPLPPTKKPFGTQGRNNRVPFTKREQVEYHRQLPPGSSGVRFASLKQIETALTKKLGSGTYTTSRELANFIKITVATAKILLGGAEKSGAPKTLSSHVKKDGEKIRLLMTLNPDGTIEWNEKPAK